MNRAIAKQKTPLLKSTSSSKDINSHILKSNKTSDSKLNNVEISDDIEYLKKLTKRLLFPHQFDLAKGKPPVTQAFDFEVKQKSTSTLATDLPPLSVSNDFDVHLYALFSLLIDNFVLKWYDDRNGLGLPSRDVFVEEMVFLFAHISRNIQERLITNQDELIKLFVLDLPFVIHEHLKSLENISARVSKDSSTTEQDTYKAWKLIYSDGLADEIEYSCYRRILTKRIVKLLLPLEISNSNISREFVVSLLNDLILRATIESFCDNFVIWDIIGKISKALMAFSINGNTRKFQKHDSAHPKREKTRLHQVMDFFLIDEKFEMKEKDRFRYTDFIPLMSCVFLITSFDSRFPLVSVFFKVLLFSIMKISIINRFISNLIKRTFLTTILSEHSATKVVDFLRHLMFPLDDTFNMKPRIIPQNEQELKEVYDKNFECLKICLQDNKFFFCKNSDIPDIATRTLGVFADKEVNKIFIQQLLDTVFKTVFPELLYSDINDQ